MAITAKINSYYTEEDFIKILKEKGNIYTSNKGKYKDAVGEGTHFNNSALRKLRVMAAHTITQVEIKGKDTVDAIFPTTSCVITFGDPDSTNKVGFTTKDGGRREKYLTIPLNAIPNILKDDGYYITMDALHSLNYYISIANGNANPRKNVNKHKGRSDNVRSMRKEAKEVSDLLGYCADCYNDLMWTISKDHLMVDWADKYFYCYDIDTEYYTIADFVHGAKSEGDWLKDMYTTGDCDDISQTKREANACYRFVEVFTPYIDIEKNQVENQVKAANYVTEKIVEKKYGAQAIIEKSSEGDIPVRKNPVEDIPQEVVKSAKKAADELEKNDKYKNHILCKFIDNINSIKDADEEIYKNTIIAIHWSNIRHKYVTLWGSGEKKEYTEAEFLKEISFSDVNISSNLRGFLESLANAPYQKTLKELQLTTSDEEFDKILEKVWDMYEKNELNKVFEKFKLPFVWKNSGEKLVLDLEASNVNSVLFDEYGRVLGYDSKNAKETSQTELREKYLHSEWEGDVTEEDIIEGANKKTERRRKTAEYYKNNAEYYIVHEPYGKKYYLVPRKDAKELGIKDKDIIYSIMNKDWRKGVQEWQETVQKNYKNYIDNSYAKAEYAKSNTIAPLADYRTGENLTESIPKTFKVVKKENGKIVRDEKGDPVLEDTTKILVRDIYIDTGNKTHLTAEQARKRDRKYSLGTNLNSRVEHRKEVIARRKDAMYEKDEKRKTDKYNAVSYLIKARLDALSSIIDGTDNERFKSILRSEIKKFIDEIYEKAGSNTKLNETQIEYKIIQMLSKRKTSIPSVDVHFGDDYSKYAYDEDGNFSYSNSNLRDSFISDLIGHGTVIDFATKDMGLNDTSTFTIPTFSGTLQTVDLPNMFNENVNPNDYIFILSERDKKNLLARIEKRSADNPDAKIPEIAIDEFIKKKTKEMFDLPVPSFYVELTTPPPRISKRYLADKYYGCIYVAIIFYLYVSNTPIDEPYEYTMHVKPELKSGRVGLYKEIEVMREFKNGTKRMVKRRVLKDKSEIEAEVNAKTEIKEGHDVKMTHEPDDSYVRGDWVLNFRGKKFKAFHTEPPKKGFTYTGSWDIEVGESFFDARTKVDGIMTMDVVKQREIDIINLANFINENTESYEPKVDSDGNPIFDQSSYAYTIENINPRWAILEEGGYVNKGHTEAHIGSKYGFKHGTVNGYSYQAPQGFVRLTEAYINSSLTSKTGRNKYVTSLINQFTSIYRSGKIDWERYFNRYVYPKYFDVSQMGASWGQKNFGSEATWIQHTKRKGK